MSTRTFNDDVIEAVKGCLGIDGIKYFFTLKERYGTISPVIMEVGMMCPHVVHFHEGMQIRNFLRRSGLCDDWTDHELDDTWTIIIDELLRRCEDETNLSD